jgi:hypothetical protein
MGSEPQGDSVLRVPVTHILPSRVMGLGGVNPEYVTRTSVPRRGHRPRPRFDRLRIGMRIAITDADHQIGRGIAGAR